MGGQNSVQPEKTLQRGALEQYLTGGFNVNAIVTQVGGEAGARRARSERGRSGAWGSRQGC